MNDMSIPILFIAGTILCGLSIIWGSAAASHHYEAQAIERGYALYCPKDGEFAWKGECDVEK